MTDDHISPVVHHLSATAVPWIVFESTIRLSKCNVKCIPMMALMDGIEDIDIDVHIVDAVVRLTQWHPIWSFLSAMPDIVSHLMT